MRRGIEQPGMRVAGTQIMDPVNVSWIVDSGGVRGRVVAAPGGAPADAVLVEFEGGLRALIPKEAIRQDTEGVGHLTFSLRDAAVGSEAPGQVRVVPVSQEQLHVRTVAEPVARVTVTIKPAVEKHEVSVDLNREELEVERVEVNREVETPEGTRQEGEVTVIPIYEEVLVVRKQLVLKSELHITRRRTTTRETQQVELRREEAHVERTAPDSA